MRVPAASSPAIQRAQPRHGLGELGRRHRLEPERPHRVVAAPDPEDHAARVELRRASRARSRVTAGWRVSGFVTPLPTAMRSVAASAWVM